MKQKKKLPTGQSFTTDFALDQLVSTQTKAVPEGEYFVLGDNRRLSDDSRYFGYVDEESIQGTIYFRYYPFNKMGAQ